MKAALEYLDVCIIGRLDFIRSPSTAQLHAEERDKFPLSTSRVTTVNETLNTKPPGTPLDGVRNVLQDLVRTHSAITARKQKQAPIAPVPVSIS